MATSLFFDQGEHANFLGNQESVTLSVMFLLTPSWTGRFAAGENSFHPGSQLGQLCLILSAPGVKEKISREYHSAYTSNSFAIVSGERNVCFFDQVCLVT